MSFDAARKSSEKILENWGTLPVAFDDVNFDSTKYENWARTYVVDGDTFGVSIGDNCVTYTGLIMVQLFTKKHSGSAPARQYGDEVAKLFKGVVDNGVIYRPASAVRVGYSGGFYQLNISIPWELTTN